MNLKEMLSNALVDGDTLETVRCFYQAPRSYRYGDVPLNTIECAGNELPIREFDDGFGGKNGEPFVGFSDNWVYISVEYDGSEWISAVPRNPETVNQNAHIESYGG